VSESSVRNAGPFSRKHHSKPPFGAVAIALVALAASFFPHPSSAATAAATTTALTITPPSSMAAQQIVTLAASVQAGGQPVTVGTVSFVDGKLYLGSVQVVRNPSHGYVPGTATLKTALGVGTHSIVATFLPTATLASSASASQPVTITANAGLLLQGPNASGQLTAILSASGPATPTGSVLFSNQTSNTALGTVPVDAGGFNTGFAPVVSLPAAQPVGFAVVDLNGDGLPDMLVSTFPDFRLAGMYPNINNGNGAFTSGASIYSFLAPGTFPLMLADYNGDGVVDFAQAMDGELQLNGQSENSLVVYLGAGDGTFPTNELLVSTLQSGSVTLLFGGTGDFNGDGIPDLTVTDPYPTPPVLYIFPGNGDGTFTAPITPSGMPANVTSQVVQDFNQDGFADFALTLSGQNAVLILLGKGDGTFQSPVSYPTGNNPIIGTMLQSRGNGVTDLALINQADSTLGILLGKGDGTFQAQTTYPLSAPGQTPNQIVAADVTGDGLQDIVLLNGPSADATINPVYSLTTFAGNGDGTYQLPTQYTFSGVGAGSLASADFDGNGVTELAVLDFTNFAIDIFSHGLSEELSLTATVYGNGPQEIAATYSGDSNYSPVTSNSVPVIGAGNPPPPTYTVAASPSSLTIAAGSTGTVKITVTPQNGFNSAVQFACSGLPANSTCTFSPSTVTPNSAAISTSLTVTTDVTTAANRAPAQGLGGIALSFALLLGLGSLGGMRASGRRLSLYRIGGRWNGWVFFGALLLATGVSLGCGGGGGTKPSGPVTPAGTATLTITATSTGSTGTAPTATLTVIVTN
jgi:trimeric autotransporter adhesin